MNVVGLNNTLDLCHSALQVIDIDMTRRAFHKDAQNIT